MHEDGYDKGAHQSYLGTERNTLSFQTGFSLLNADVVSAILDSVSGLEPSSIIIEPRYLKLVTQDGCLKLLSIHFDLCVDAIGVVCHQLGILGTDLHAIVCGGFVKMLK